MDKHYLLGRKITLALYTAMGPYVVGYCIISKAVSIKVAMLFMAFWAITLVCCLFIKVKEPYSYFMLISAAMLSCAIYPATGSLYAMMNIFLVQWLGAIFFMQLDICTIVLVVQTVALIAMSFFPFNTMPDLKSFVDFGCCIIPLLVSGLICRKLIVLLTDEVKMNEDLVKQVEERYDEAREALNAKSEFLANMSHEIRTPINVIIGMNEVALRECSDPGIHEYLQSISTASQSLMALINDVLDFSKIEAGRVQLVEATYNVSEVLDNSAKMNIVKAREKNLDLEFNVSPNLPVRLRGDSMRIGQIINNIVSNALKYTNEGQVTVSVWSVPLADPSTVMLYLEIKDTGIGIQEEDMGKLFVGFQRLDLYHNRSIEGTGLGLRLTMEIVKAMGGDIDVQSTYGVGSVFTVHFPQKVDDNSPIGNFKVLQTPADKPVNAAYHSLFTAPRAKVLVVDDNNLNLLVTNNLLKPTKVQATLCTCGQECLDKMCEEHFDLIFLDHMMPHMDGVETLERAKHMPGNKCVGVPVIALTANAISGAREQYIEAGFDGYLSKPIISLELEKVMLTFLPQELIDSRWNREIGMMQAPDGRVIPYEDQVIMEIPDRPAPRIDKALGMKYCAGMDDVYNEIAGLYLSEGTKQLTVLQKQFENEDWKSYAISVHSLKSTSLTIGAEGLSSLAKEQEMAAKEGRYDDIKGSHRTLISEYRAVLNELAGSIGKGGNS